jgi:hypothetical protein
MWVLDLAGQIDDVRNGLLLFKPIAWAFNTSRICFEWDTEEQRYAPHLLDARLKETTLIDKLLELNAEVGAAGAVGWGEGGGGLSHCCCSLSQFAECMSPLVHIMPQLAGSAAH